MAQPFPPDSCKGPTTTTTILQVYSGTPTKLPVLQRPLSVRSGEQAYSLYCDLQPEGSPCEAQGERKRKQKRQWSDTPKLRLQKRKTLNYGLSLPCLVLLKPGNEKWKLFDV